MAIEMFSLEDLSQELKKHVVRVREQGLGVCSKCRWQSGCLACDGEKAWRWAVSKQLGIPLRTEKTKEKEYKQKIQQEKKA